jgi:cytochrome b subunit of formate dehydrogenase
MLPPYITISIVILLIVILITGIYWWIPKYVPADKQDTATHWLLVSFSGATLILNLINSNVVGATGSSLGLVTSISAGKRK